MSKIQLRIYDLRKRNQIGQKELANKLGVSVDELLGLIPLTGEKYIPVKSGEKEYWEQKGKRFFEEAVRCGRKSLPVRAGIMQLVCDCLL